MIGGLDLHEPGVDLWGGLPDGVLDTGDDAPVKFVDTYTAHSSLGGQNLLTVIQARARLKNRRHCYQNNNSLKHEWE